MRTTMKKWLTGILAVAMLASMTVVPVAADEAASDAAETAASTEAAETTTESTAHIHSLNEGGVCTTCEMNVLSLLNTAYIYSFPLVLMDVTAEKVTNTETATYTQAPTNQFIHVPAFANAEAKDIVLPNVDTLYSQAFLDLTETAVIMELPKTDRFCIMQAMDAYSNTIDIIECMNLEDRTTYIFTGPDFVGTIPEGMIEIKSPTNMVWILGRTVCGDNENNIADGYFITKTIQYQMKMYTLEQYENGTTDVPLTGEVEEEYKDIVPLNYVIYNLTAEQFFDRANKLMLTNPPAAEDAMVAAAMAVVGVGPGLDFDPAVFGGEEAVAPFYGWIRQNMVANCVGASVDYNKVNGVWSYYGDPIGDYGTAYAFRCLIALAGFGANPAEMAIYPAATTDITGAELTGANAYTIHLNKEQIALLNKHNGYGFWSITAYGTDQYLIANEDNRYCINDRNVVYNEDGSIDLYVAKDAPADAEKYPNWLPVGEEGFKLYFRIYLPCEEILENNWTMPGIVKVEEADEVEAEAENPVEAETDAVTYTVVAGDTLWSISGKYYGTCTKWGMIYEANTNILQNPKMIYAGQVLVIP